MGTDLTHRRLNDATGMSEQDIGAVLARARELEAARRHGTLPRVLRGKNLALLRGGADDAGAALFEHAAVALGAKVATLRPSLSEASSAQEVQHTARLLGRLYDAVDCLGLSPKLIRRIGADAGVPVFADLASPGHPTARLTELLDADAPPDANRCLVIQAVLTIALA